MVPFICGCEGALQRITAQALVGDGPSRRYSPPRIKKGVVMKHLAKQTTTLTERLLENVARLRQELEGLPPGPKRDRIEQSIRQSNTAVQLEGWLSSPGLQPPTGPNKPPEGREA